MAILGDALRQAFMPKSEYDSLREEQKAWGRLQRPLVLSLAAALTIAIAVAVAVSLAIVFPGEASRRPFCRDRGRIKALRLANVSLDAAAGSESYHGVFYLTDEEAADYYWMAVFLPSAIVFSVSTVYLLSGMIVAYSAPTRHPCLKVVENNYCASKRGYALSSVEGRVAMEFFDMSEAGQAKKYAFKCHRKSEAGRDTVYPVNAIAFHPIYGTFATGGCDGYVNVWDGNNKKRLYQYSKYPSSIAALSFSKDGRLLAVASSYTFEEGDMAHEPDAIFVRNVNEVEVKPKPKALPAPPP